MKQHLVLSFQRSGIVVDFTPMHPSFFGSVGDQVVLRANNIGEEVALVDAHTCKVLGRTEWRNGKRVYVKGRIRCSA